MNGKTRVFTIGFTPMDVSIQHGEKKDWGSADSLVFRTEQHGISIQYAGETADHAQNLIQMPKNPAFLRQLAKKLNALAKELEPPKKRDQQSNK